MGLTYDVSFELNLFDKLDLGWYVIAVTSTPSKVHKAVDACKGVLRGLHSNKIVERELDRAKRTLLMKHEAETKTNAYWLGLLAHLQSSSVPRKVKHKLFVCALHQKEKRNRIRNKLTLHYSSNCIGTSFTLTY
jgi:predicted Zn-dependent peptidase